MLRRRASSWPILVLSLAGCASNGASSTGSTLASDSSVEWGRLWPELVRADAASAATGDGLFPVRRPDQAGVERLKQAERLWRDKDDAGFDAVRDHLAEDPILAFWLSRMLVRDVLFHRERVAVDEAIMVGEPTWRRPFDHLVAMGSAAAPCVVLDLLRDPSVDRRELGSELLGAMGAAALPAWERVFDVDDVRVRRYAVRALVGWDAQPETLAILDRAIADADIGVRAQAWRAIGRCGPDAGGRLRAALPREADPFVQRAIIEALGDHPDRASAVTVVAYLERAAADDDVEAQDAARRALMRISGRDEPGSPASWRRWLETWGGGASR